MDRQSVYTLSLFGEEQSANGDSSNKQTQRELVAFVLDFHLEGNYIYRYAVQRGGGGGGENAGEDEGGEEEEGEQGIENMSLSASV